MIAAPGIPGGGVMAALGLLETMFGFGTVEKPIMIALHAAQDSFGTATNITGDGAIACLLYTSPKYANLARGEVLTVKEEVYIQAAKLSGNSNFHILIKHIIPNIYGKLLVVGTLDIGTMIMELSGLSFLGLCSPLPLAELGSMMSEGKSYIQFAPWLILAPGITILIIVIIFNIFGDTMQELINSKKNRG